jgi:DNA-binding SARP family transcriptional activator
MSSQGGTVIEYTVLGQVAAWHESWTARLSPQQQLLLARLVIARGMPVPRADLVRALWDDPEPPEDGLRRPPEDGLRRVVAELRAQLRKAPAAALPGADPLPVRGDTYRLLLSEQQADVLRFRSKIAKARRVTGREATRLMREAMQEWGKDATGLFGGQPLTGLQGYWADGCRTNLRAEYRDARLHCLMQDFADQLYDSVAGECQQLENEPAALHAERFVELWMIATYRAGRRAEALQIYQRAADSVRNEQGLEPSGRLRRLAEIIRDEDHSKLDGPADLLDLLSPNLSRGLACQPRPDTAELIGATTREPRELGEAIDVLFADWEQATQQLAGTRRAFADEQQLKISQAARLVMRGQPIPALRLYRQVLAADPDNAPVLFDVAAIASSVDNRLRKAIVLLDHAEARCPDRRVATRIIGLRGYCRYKLNEFSAAVHDLESALAMPGIRRNRLDLPSMWYLSASYLELGQPKEAAETLRELQRLTPDTVEVPMMLARIAAAAQDAAAWDRYAAAADRTLRGHRQVRGEMTGARFAALAALCQLAAAAGWPDRAGRWLREAAEVALRTGRDGHTAEMQQHLEVVASLLEQAPDKNLLAWMLNAAVTDPAGDLVLAALAKHGVISQAERSCLEKDRGGHRKGDGCDGTN